MNIINPNNSHSTTRIGNIHKSVLSKIITAIIKFIAKLICLSNSPRPHIQASPILSNKKLICLSNSSRPHIQASVIFNSDFDFDSYIEENIKSSEQSLNDDTKILNKAQLKLNLLLIKHNKSIKTTKLTTIQEKSHDYSRISN